MRRRCRIAVFLPAVVLLLLPVVAFAGKGILLTIENGTGQDITVIPGGENCYYGNDLEKRSVHPPGAQTYYAEEKNSGGCFFTDRGGKHIQFSLQLSDGKIYQANLKLVSVCDERVDRCVEYRSLPGHCAKACARSHDGVQLDVERNVLQKRLRVLGGECGGQMCVTLKIP